MIRQLLSADAAAFQRIRLLGLLEFPSAFSTTHAEERDQTPSDVAGRLADAQGGAVFGAFHDGELAGIVGIQRDRRQLHAHKALLWGMYVTPRHRSLGLGRLLVMQALRHAREVLKIRSVLLRVNTGNQPAMTLYETMGFKRYGTEAGSLLIDGTLHDEHLMAWANPDATSNGVP